MTDGTIDTVNVPFGIIAEAKGGAFGFQEIDAQIVVCGWEEIGLVEEGQILYEYHPLNEIAA